MNYVAAHQSITLTTSLGRGSVDITQVVFEILGPDGTVVDQSPPVAMANRRASWQWTPNRTGVTTLADDKDTVVVSPRVAYSFDGTTMHAGLDDVTVFRDRVNIKVVTTDGENVKDARVRLIVHRKGIFTKQTLGSTLTNPGGVAEFTGILRWTRLAVQVKSPWEFNDDASPYRVGHAVGLNREVEVVPKKYLAAFKGIKVRESDDFEVIPELGGQRRQFVNFEEFSDEHDTLFAGENTSYYGFVIQLLVAPAENPGEFEGDPIFVKLICDPQNGLRNKPKPMLAGADANGIAQLTLGANGVVATVSLGVTGGDKFTLQVCSAKKFSTVPDEEFEIINWRRVYREIRVPAAMCPALTQVALPPSAGPGPHYDLPNAVLQHMNQILEPLFIDYKLSRTLVFANDKTPAPNQLIPATFFERDDNRDLYIGSYFTQSTDAAKFTTGKDHTIYMTLFDVYFGASAYGVPQTVEFESTTSELEPSTDRRFFIPHLEAVCFGSEAEKKLVESGSYFDKRIAWTAVIDPKEYEKSGHPGLVGGKPRKGLLELDCAAAINHKLLRITLPAEEDTDPGSFVGPKSDETCPIELTFKIHEVMLSGGGDLNGSQVIYLHPRADVTGTIVCHELAHAIGMTPIGPGTMHTLPGLETPKHVDEGGTYYRDPKGGDTAGQDGVRSHGQGPHCAHGLSDVTIQDYPLKIPDDGCVMYAYAPSPRFPYAGRPHLFCDTCKTLMKAYSCADLH